MTGLPMNIFIFVVSIFVNEFLSVPAIAASFDCAKANTKTEHVICDNPDISKLDEDLASAYKNALNTPANTDAIRQEQKKWLKARNTCQDALCVKNAYQQRLTLLSVPNAPQARDSSAYGFKGEFILSRNEYQNPICQRFVQNLNQFRKLDFNVCNPRLSEKFPEFSRPKWEEIPFDITLAEEIIKDNIARRHTSSASAELAEKYWQDWLAQTAAIRAGGQAHMWRTRIDLDGDGKDETIIRMVPEYGFTTKLKRNPPLSCDYNIGTLHMKDNIHQTVSDAFNTESDGDDILYFAEDKRYYQVVWNSAGPAYMNIDIGATAGVEINQLNWDGFNVTGDHICLIDWVPTGHYKPLIHKQ